MVSAQATHPPTELHKQLLDVGGRPMLLRVVDALLGSRVRRAVVVTNAQVAPVAHEWRPAGARLAYAINPDPDGEMIESVQLGLRTLGAECDGIEGEPARAAGYLVCPGDHPLLTSCVVDRCLDMFAQDPTRLVIAAHQGKRGHPLIVPAELACELLSWPAQRRLNELRELHADRVRLCEVREIGAVVDVDTPEDLARARRHHRVAEAASKDSGEPISD